MDKTKLILAAAALLLTTACANEDVNKDNDNAANKGLTAFVSGDEPASRTSMDHTAGGKGKFFWTTGDNIWVDNASTPESSTSSSITGKTDYAKFYFASTFPGTSYPVTYTGKSSTKSNEVTIAANQTQSAPNNTEHFATSGDCGTATATGSGNEFTFKLKHQAAYLCILPRCTNVPLGKNIYLTKIVVTSDNDIAGTYTLLSTGLTPKSGGTKTITLTTQGTGSDPGFKLTNTTANITLNGAYLVIAPGAHTLTIDCYIKDPVTNVEGPITQTVSTTFAANTVTDITANLTPTIYSADSYYMWDAQQSYWHGHLDSNGMPDGNYPQSDTTDPDRWFHQNGGLHLPISSYATVSSPNANEVAWYSNFGDPHWDNTTFWAILGHLYKGGMWLKKKSKISGYRTDASPNGIDYTESAYVLGYIFDNSSITTGKPGNLSEYFYLPALGFYYNGTLHNVGSNGYYWSSTPHRYQPTQSFNLFFNSGHAEAQYSGNRDFGCPLWTAQ